MSEERIEQCIAWLKTLEDPGDRFIFGRVLGEGNSSIVHEAQDPDGRVVAIKIVDELDENLEDIHEEFGVLSEVCQGNPRFPQFLGVFRVSSGNPCQVWFVMEACEEGSMEDLLYRMKPKDKILKENVISYVLKELLIAVKELHDRSIVHRDIRASNILVSRDGDIKLTDFGLARRVDNPEGKLQSTAGSPYWMAPEVTVAERSADLAYDSRADVWSVGITAAELGDGAAPLAEVYAPRALFQVIQNPPPTLRKTSEWTQLYNDFISECLEKNIDHRPWSCEILEHPFLNENVDHAQGKASLVRLLNEYRDQPPAPREREVTVKSDSIKMNRQQAPQKLSQDDLATLHRVSEDAVMETLYQRFAQGNIYTYLGDILIVINPFGPEKHQKLYNLEMASRYKYKARCDNAPHIYGVADRAYQDMLHHQELQNIVLTGETGSGKTTAGKHLLWHLANMTASNKKMVERVLHVATVTTAFGNASTTFNSSATRFIQYLELTFTKTGKLSGGILTGYNLEKWRITSKGRLNQSNFHIFYYLIDTLAATDQSGKYFLTRGTTYEYLPECPNHSPKQNVERLREVKEAFNVLDFSLDEQETIVKVLAAILLIGQLRFQGEDEATLINPEVVEKIASLLDVDKKKLAWTFTNFCVVASGEVVKGKCNVEESIEMRDSLARSLYCRLFDWIINLINTKLSFTRLVFGDQNSLAILDLPGFECFAQDNTLDQFLINMTNEQMQFFYNQRVFVWEMQDYEKEELSAISYDYHDNRELLDITLSKPIGLLAFLDDETKTSNNDHRNFLGQVQAQLHTRFIRKVDETSFHVAHYSGQVNYDARNFVERNKNFLSPEMIQVMRISENPTVVQLYSNPMTKTGNLTINESDVQQTRWTSAISVTSGHPKVSQRYNTKSKGKFSQSRQMQTIAATTRNSLLELLQKVSCGSAHFVRCIRSNLKQEPSSFDRDLVRYQFRALGIIDSIRVRQLGYSRRLKFPEFLKRYKFLAFDFDEKVEDTGENCRLLLIRLKMEGWALGKSRVFLKYYNEEYLSRLYENQVHKVIKIQSMMRAFLARKKTTARFPRLVALRQAAADGKVPTTYPGGFHGNRPSTNLDPYGGPMRPGTGNFSGPGPKYAPPSYSGASTRTTTPVLFEGPEKSPGKRPFVAQPNYNQPGPGFGHQPIYNQPGGAYGQPTSHRPQGGAYNNHSGNGYGHNPQPSFNNSRPQPSYNRPSGGYNQSSAGYGQQSYVRPSGGYVQPAYNPPPSFNRPPARGGYGQQPSAYGNGNRPQSNYNQQPTNYNRPGGYNQSQPGYNRVYSSSNASSTYGGINDDRRSSYGSQCSGVGGGGGYRRECLTPPEIDTNRPPSPRDIAKAFEAAARDSDRSAPSGRYRPSSPRGSLSPTRPDFIRAESPNRLYASPSSGNSRSPEVISPLEEFTNMANKMKVTPNVGSSPTFKFDVHDTHVSRTSPEGRDRVELSPGFVVEGICEDL